MADDLNPVRVMALFKAIATADLELLDMPGRPEDLVMTTLPVPPLAIRPSVEMDIGGGSNEDDITVIVKARACCAFLGVSNQLPGTFLSPRAQNPLLDSCQISRVLDLRGANGSGRRVCPLVSRQVETQRRARVESAHLKRLHPRLAGAARRIVASCLWSMQRSLWPPAANAWTRAQIAANKNLRALRPESAPCPPAASAVVEAPDAPEAQSGLCSLKLSFMLRKGCRYLHCSWLPSGPERVPCPSAADTEIGVQAMVGATSEP